jgi:hypothetical protein
MAGPKIDKIEKEKRIRTVMEWILDDHATHVILRQISKTYGVSDRQAKRYLRIARERWTEEEQLKIDKKKRIKIQQLIKLKRSLKTDYLGTPMGMRAVLAIEKQIIQLDIEPANRIQHSGGSAPE